MSKKRYKLLISDVDGTLTTIAPHALPSISVTKSIQRAVKEGLIFSLASGRPFSLLTYIIHHLGMIGPCIVDNGAVIVDSKDGSVMWEAVLDDDHARRILELSKPFPLIKVSCNLGLFDNPKTIPPNAKVRKISIHDISMSEAEDLITKINLELNDIASAKAVSYKGNHLVDLYFSNIQATKQHAVVKLSEILDVKHEEIIGVGDGYNDFPLLMASGLKVAMGNAVDELKQIADYVGPSVENDGLTDVLEKYFFN